MKKMVLGFLFNWIRTKVVLINKVKPEWQKGKLNGVGGKIERGEKSIAAMRREWQEETGTKFKDWKLFCVMKGPDFVVDCYTGIDQTYADEVVSHIEATTDETPLLIPVSELYKWSRIPNLDWLIPMARDFLNSAKFQVDVKYE